MLHYPRVRVGGGIAGTHRKMPWRNAPIYFKINACPDGEPPSQRAFMLKSCPGQVVDTLWARFGHVFGHVLDMSWTCFGHVFAHVLDTFLDTFWTRFGHVLDTFWTRFGHVFGHVLDTFWTRFGHVLYTFLDTFLDTFWHCTKCALYYQRLFWLVLHKMEGGCRRNI